ncbi:chromosome partitioning protein ParB [Candidatus Woesearchaeota archaeon]|nr:chromosome partitioning protein ParB [Candidatus Woesearchaeota archaeon]
MKFTIKEAQQYARDGLIEQWAHQFLSSIGRNHALSAGLLKEKRYWLGPVMVKFEKLDRCCGPETTMEYVEKLENWENNITQMTDSIRDGWEALPFIGQYRNGRISIRDGNHRFEALKRIGFTAYWTIIWCDSQEQFNEANLLFNA